MLKKTMILMLSWVVIASSLTGCGASAEIDALNKASVTDTSVLSEDNKNMSYTDEQNAIYAQVSDREMLDTTKLEACTENDRQQVINYMDSVDDQLNGKLKEKDYVIDECFTNYLIHLFEQTPYYWERTKMTIRGIDGESRSIIVDVDYKTVDYKKEVKGDSYIVKGDPNYEKYSRIRLQKYRSMLDSKYHPTNNDADNYETRHRDFVKFYGEPEEIYKTQRIGTLTEQIAEEENNNQVTYNGMIDYEEEQSGATMTIRYVLIPDYVLGVNLGMDCKHMYLFKYNLTKDPTKDKEAFTGEGYDTVTDSVYSTLYSYFQCIDESDYRGLFKLTENFDRLDKYYNDMFDTTYSKHDNFTMSVFDISGTTIKTGITVSTKVRPKGSNMTYPLYTDRYYAILELDKKVLKVKNLVLISREVVGEPKIISGEADIEGFVSDINLTNEDKQEIEKLIRDFGVVQLNKDTKSDNFGNIVDLTMDTGDLSTLKENMNKISGSSKVTWITNYMQGNPSYASVQCKENFKSDEDIIETNVIYDFIVKGNKWYITKYNVTQSSILGKGELTTGGSLCHVDKNGVKSYNTQISGGGSAENVESTDVSFTIDYDEYIPDGSSKKDNKDNKNNSSTENTTGQSNSGNSNSLN